MGRVLRIRKRKKKTNKKEIVSFTRDVEYLELITWMKQHGWKPSCKLISAYFDGTGRGLMAKENIFAGTAIARIPYSLLITVRTVLESEIRWIFTNKNSFMTQQVLSTFLVWEYHLGEASVWKKYINCLPKTFSCPAFCDNVSWLPESLKVKVRDIKEKIMKTHNSICYFIKNRKCSHCQVFLTNVFTYDLYLWAWCIVSTRAVYLCPEVNSQDSVLLSDENTLALAPYIDLFNHSYQTAVKAYAIESEGIYQIETLMPFPKNKQIFINYGPLSNDRLFIEYGFIIPSNIQDSISFSHDDILLAVNGYIPSNRKINEFRFKFLKEKNLFNKICCYADGLSWDCQALIYVFLCSPELKIEEIKHNIFSDKFKTLSWGLIKKIAEIVVKKKLNDFTNDLMILQKHQIDPNIRSDCFAVACNLYKEYLKLLDKCLIALRKDKIE